VTADRRSRVADLARAAAPAGFTLLVAALLLIFPPAQYGFYPRCPINQYFHVLCPGCGSTRALAALLHGSFAEAFRLNALTTLVGPIALVYAGICYRRMLSCERSGWPQPPTAAIYSTLAVAAIFTIARNL
jgi:hypothetical protein